MCVCEEGEGASEEAKQGGEGGGVDVSVCSRRVPSVPLPCRGCGSNSGADGKCACVCV